MLLSILEASKSVKEWKKCVCMYMAGNNDLFGRAYTDEAPPLVSRNRLAADVEDKAHVGKPLAEKHCEGLDGKKLSWVCMPPIISEDQVRSD